ncbi:major tail protein [Arthrobacter phage Caterpillar]|nr:major tail protein [Arthrobacter phage Caterpillar]
MAGPYKAVGADADGNFPPRIQNKLKETIDKQTVKEGTVNGNGELILKRADDTTFNAGVVKGAKGDTGPAGGVNSIDGRTGNITLGVPYMGHKDVRTPLTARGAVNTGVNGGVDVWTPEINGLQKDSYYRQKFAAGTTNKWYINNQILLGTRAEVRGKSILLRFEQKDVSATSIRNEPITVAINKVGDWGPGSYFTVVPLTDAKVKVVSEGLYLIRLDDWIDPAMVDADTVHLNLRILNRSLPNATSSYHYSSDFWFRASIVDEAELNFTTVASQTSVLQGFTDDARRFAKVLPTAVSNNGGSGGSTLVPVGTASGLATRYTRPQTTQPDGNWNYQFASSSLGKVSDLKGKKYFFRFDDSLSEMKVTGQVGLGKNAAQWANVKFSMDASSYWTIKKGDDLYALCKAANLLDTDNIYFLGGQETRSATTPAINWEIGVAWLEDASSAKGILVADMLAGFDASKYVTKDYVDAKQPPYITCWGDSLTAGGGWTGVLAADLGITVNNAGTGGESTNTIVARQGADVMQINNITIPATTTAVQIGTHASGIPTQLGKVVKPLLQGGGSHVNPVKIDGIEGTLAFTGSSYSDTTGVFTFTRSVAGSEVVINRPTAIRTKADREWNDGLMIVFIGQNGGHSDDADLVNRHKLMKAHYKGRFKMVVLGLSSGSAASRASYEAAMRLEFGRYFISLREYLSTYGIADAGLTPTQADTDAMATGTVPPQLLTDTVHYTDACKTVIGKMLVKKLRELQVVTT